MSRVPLGKVLLRNVIRHTDAHNKIQEESEMWKIREWEKQTQDVHWGKQKRTLSNCSSSRMRSDGFDEESQHAEWKVKNLAPVSETMEDDLRHARYWNRKLYEYEANMPDRWGHSGYKELYPEEFDTDSDQPDEQNSVNGKRKSQPGKQSSLELHKSKKAKKSHKKKRKKKSHKKRKKKKREQPNVASDSSQDTECSEEGVSRKRKRRHHKKAKKAAVAASAKPPASSSGPDSDSSRAGSCTSSSSEGSEPEEKPEKPPRKKRRRRHVSLSDRSGEGVQEKRSKRKNWKVAADENSEDSSDED